MSRVHPLQNKHRLLPSPRKTAGHAQARVAIWYPSAFIVTAISALIFSPGISAAASTRCSPLKIKEILSPARTGAWQVAVDCSLELKREDVVTKRLVLQGSAATGVKIDCNGATIKSGPDNPAFRRPRIEIQSRKFRDSATGAPRWDAPHDITVQGCNIKGSIHIWGMSPNGEGPELRESSRLPGHSVRARKNAPRDILLDRLTITGTQSTPLYIGPGVTRVRLSNSELKGRSGSVAIYLDAESADNTIIRNSIHTATGNGRGPNPAIFLGSRDGRRKYCNADRGYPMGSSESDLDYATHNVVMQNQIFKRKVEKLIRTQHAAVNGPNYIGKNETVESAVERKAGCFVSAKAEKFFVRHGETIAAKGDIGRTSCGSAILRCLDGELLCPVK